MIREYKIQKRLGIGSYGTVYQVSHKDTNQIYVIKQISLYDLTQEEISNVKMEAKILKTINSKYVVKYFDSFEENNHLNIVMEYCNGGDLGEYLDSKKEKNEKISEDLVWLIFIKITLGLAAIHKLKILHRDLKTLNIFLCNNLEIKIGDLGVAKILNNSGSFAKTLIGTPYYLSPELCEEKPYNNKSDIWALGCILYELCTFQHPFSAKSQAGLIIKILKENPESIGNYYSVELQNIINNIFEKNMEKRPACFDILTNDIIVNKAKNFGLLNEISKLYPESHKINMLINNNNEKILIYNKNISKNDYLKNKSFIINNISDKNINNISNKSKDNIYLNKNKIKNKKHYNSISTESKINNNKVKKEPKKYDKYNIKNNLFSKLTPMNNNIKVSNISHNINGKKLPNKLFIKKFLNKSHDKNDICNNNVDNGRYTNIEQKKLILIKKNGKIKINSSKSQNKLLLDLSNSNYKQIIKKKTPENNGNKRIENKIVFIKKSDSKLNGKNYINSENNVINNNIITRNIKEECKNDNSEKERIQQNNIEYEKHKNIKSSIELFESELKNYYRYSSNINHINEDKNINGLNRNNKISFVANINLKTIDILNDEKEYDNNKDNNLNDFVKNLNQYIPQYKISKQNKNINISKKKMKFQI